MPDTIAHYRVVSKLGEGGMGVVYAAADERLQRRVAIKMVRGTSADPQSRARLWREARAAASVSHPNVCQLYEIGEANGELFIAMELLEGESALGEARARAAAAGRKRRHHDGDAVGARRDARGRTRAPRPEAVEHLSHGARRQAARLRSGPRGREADDLTHGDITMAGTVMGTPHYMSPEQLTRRSARRRDPICSRRGRSSSSCWWGRPPFPGKTAAQVFHSIMYEPLPSVGGSPALAAVDRIIHRATAKRPTDRYPDAAAMAQEIRAALRLADSGETPTARMVTRLIVLPFRMLRPDPEIDFLSFSLADAITASLGSLESLVVRSTLAASRFKADGPI